MACVFLMRAGYSVFRNVCAKGPIDIIAVRGHELRKFDVKSTDPTKSGRILSRVSMKTKYQQENNIEILHVESNGKCYFENEVVSQIINTNATKICLQCQRSFQIFKPQQMSKKFCSEKCREMSYIILK